MTANFVPIARHPADEETDYEASKGEHKLSFFEGLYAVRVILRPSACCEYFVKEGERRLKVTRFQSLVSSEQQLRVCEAQPNR